MKKLEQNPGTLNLKANKGDDFIFSLNFQNLSLTGYTLKAFVELYRTSTKVIDLTVIPVDLANGKIDIKLPKDKSSTLEVNKSYEWNLTWVTPEGDSRTVLTGRLVIV